MDTFIPLTSSSPILPSCSSMESSYLTGCTRSDRGFGICAWPRALITAPFEFS
jgi:hypothetical protein